MSFFINKLSLDMHSSISQKTISVKKGDTMRKLCVTLTENGKVYFINEGCYAVLSAKKENGGILYNACNIVDGVIEYEFTDLTANVVGRMDCEIKLYDANNGLITSPQFCIIVEGIVYADEEVENSDEFSALTKLVSSATELVTTIEEYADQAEESASEAQSNNLVAGQAAESAQSSASQAAELAQEAATYADRAAESASSAGGAETAVAEYMQRAEQAAGNAASSANKALESAREVEESYDAMRSQVAQNTEDVAQMAKDIADLKYTAIQITHISNTVGTVEMGTTVSSVTISWTLNKAPTSQKVEGTSVGVDARAYTLSGLSLTGNKTYAVTVTDERGASDVATTGISFLNGVYYGVMASGATINNASILAMTKKLQGSKGITFSVNAGAGQNIVYALPSRYGTPNFNVGGFDGGFTKATTINFTNASGYAENYDVWVSDNAGLGNTTVKVS